MSTAQQIPVVGDYYMQRGSLVLCASEIKPGWFETHYVQIGDNNVSGGGASFSWPASDYTPITDPRLYAAAQAHRAMREAAELRKAVATAEADLQIWLAAMKALTVAAKASGSAS